MRTSIPFIAVIFLAAAASGAGAADGSLATGSRVLPPVETVRYEYHDVCGCCEKDLQCEMSDKAIRWKDGNGYDSITRWKVKWDYGYKKEADRCSVDSFTLFMDIVIHLPKWVCTGHAPRALTEKWEAYIENLTRHENEHRDKALRAAEDITAAVSEMPAAAGCSQLDRSVQELLRERMQKLDDDQHDLDQATGHGFAGKPQFP